MTTITTTPKPTLDREELQQIREAYGLHLAKPVEVVPAAWQAAAAAYEQQHNVRLVKFFGTGAE